MSIAYLMNNTFFILSECMQLEQTPVLLFTQNDASKHILFPNHSLLYSCFNSLLMIFFSSIIMNLIKKQKLDSWYLLLSELIWDLNKPQAIEFCIHNLAIKITVYALLQNCKRNLQGWRIGLTKFCNFGCIHMIIEQ